MSTPTDSPSPQIISASRRTDIPAFYMPWFMNRLRDGHASYPNPFGGQLCRVSLRPEDVHSIVFWSKHYGPFLSHIEELETRGYRFICHYTITGAPRELEPHVPDWTHNVVLFRRLAERLGPQRLIWRFDPILLTDRLGPAGYLERFEQIASALEGATERCTFSFATFYHKVTRCLAASGLRWVDPPLGVKRRLGMSLAEIAARHGMGLYACCQDALVGGGVQKASCVDADLLAKLFPDRPLEAAARPTREECGCAASRDVGVYDSCPYGCVYCYATQGHDRAAERLCAHDPGGEMLIRGA